MRRLIPKAELATIIDNIGLPYSGFNLSYSNSAPIGPGDADILVELSKKHRPTEEYVHDLRTRLSSDFPGVTFYFLPADMVSQILNFGLPAPIDIQIVGRNLAGDREFADRLMNQLLSLIHICSTVCPKAPGGSAGEQVDEKPECKPRA